jgi:hypothetical protein
VGPAWQTDWENFVGTGQLGVVAVASNVLLSECDRWRPKTTQLLLWLHGRPVWC